MIIKTTINNYSINYNMEYLVSYQCKYNDNKDLAYSFF